MGRSQYPAPSGLAAMARMGLEFDWPPMEPRKGTP